MNSSGEVEWTDSQGLKAFVGKCGKEQINASATKHPSRYVIRTPSEVIGVGSPRTPRSLLLPN